MLPATRPAEGSRSAAAARRRHLRRQHGRKFAARGGDRPRRAAQRGGRLRSRPWRRRRRRLHKAAAASRSKGDTLLRRASDASRLAHIKFMTTRPRCSVRRCATMCSMRCSATQAHWRGGSACVHKGQGQTPRKPLAKCAAPSAPPAAARRRAILLALATSRPRRRASSPTRSGQRARAAAVARCPVLLPTSRPSHRRQRRPRMSHRQ